MNTDQRITIVIADDHPIVRKGLREVIEEDNELLIVGEASDGQAALDAIKKYSPQVAILDVGMPKLSGLEVVRHVKQAGVPVAIIILTVYDDEGIFSKAMELGINGYILKDSASNDIVNGIKRVAQGDYFISPSLSNGIIRRTNSTDPQIEIHLGLHLLTATERNILKLIAADKSTKEIAELFNISPRTVERHRLNIGNKLHLSGSFSLLRFAMENKNYI